MPGSPDSAALWASLSKREQSIAIKFAEGLTYQGIGEALFIAPTTVRTHLATIYRKLDVHNKAALINLVLAQRALEGTPAQEKPARQSPEPLEDAPTEPVVGMADGKSPPRIERRLAAILAADVVGYARLMERDEAGTLQRLKALRRELIDVLVAQHGGRIVNAMGDSVLCEFASVVDAVSCAVMIQPGVAEREQEKPEGERIRFRIGINLGDVLIEGDDIHGDGVNIASRLEALAAPGGIAVSATVREHIGDKCGLGFVDMGERAAKNLDKPLRVYAVQLLPTGGAMDAAPSGRGFSIGSAAIDGRPFLSRDPDQEHFSERRQVAVLFADLAGYTALADELDAEEVHALLAAFFDRVDRIVAEHGGHVDRHVGDRIMAVFGAPIAYGDDAARAASTALAIRDAMPALSTEVGRPVGAHIGVAGGQVVASSTGCATHREYTVTGATVNLAARLTDTAAPNEILISATVRRELAARIEVDAVGDTAVKGFAKPVGVWRLSSMHAPVPEHRPFAGRRDQLHQLTAGLAACRETGHGQAILVRGEAGIGKTRLIEEAQRAAREAGFASHTAMVLNFGAGTGRDAIRALLRSLLGLEVASDQAAAGAAAARALATDLVAEDDTVFLNDLLDLPQPTEQRALYDAMDSASRGRGRRETVAELVRRASARQPLLLAVEDVHWTDDGTLAYLAVLAATVPDCPAVLVMTSRLEGDPLDQAWRRAAGGSPLLTVDLGPLRRPEALALAGSFTDPGDPFALACVERAEGNPFFLEQLLRRGEEAGMTNVPASVQSLVLARMDRLPPTDRSALQAASALGQRFSPAALRHLVNDPGYDCALLVRHDLVRSYEQDFLFVHALVREGVYSSLLKARRRELHCRAASWLAGRDPVLHAQHLERAEDPAAPRAYFAAARGQASAYRTEEALALAEHGLRLARERTDHFALACLRGDLLHDLGSMEACIEAHEGALAMAEDDVERCRALLGLAAGLRIVDRHEQALQVLERAEAAAVAHDLAPELARLCHLRGNLQFMLGNLADCREQHERALEHAGRAGSPEFEARALGGLGDVAYAEGRMITALTCFRRCVELARAHGLGQVEVANQGMVPWARYYTNDPRGMLEDALAGIGAATRVGHPRAEVIARDAAYMALYDMGEVDRAVEHLARAHDLARRLGSRRLEAEVLLFRAQAELARGRREEAVCSLREGLAISRHTGMDYIGPALLGALAAATDDPGERAQALAEGEELLRRGSLSHNHLWFYRDAIEAALRIGDWDEADRVASALDDYTGGEPLPWADYLVTRARALAGFGRGRRDSGTVRTLGQLCEEAERAGMRMAAAAIAQRLSDG